MVEVIVALDNMTLEEAKAMVEKLSPYQELMFKVGLEMISAGDARELMRYIDQFDCGVLYDGKFDDIPNTVGKATARMAAVDMFNVHASAGRAAMEAAVKNRGNAQVLAVTVLTSLKEEAADIFGADAKDKVLQFARMAKEAGCQGIICSAQELPVLKAEPGLEGMLFVTPGIRPSWAQKDDQKRVMTPGEAVRAGATHLVIGRPITKPPEEVGSPLEAAKRIIEEIAIAERELQETESKVG
jgi:orotidine-5'-phosphate decarboxylase